MFLIEVHLAFVALPIVLSVYALIVIGLDLQRPPPTT